MKTEIPNVFHGLPVVTAKVMRLIDQAASAKFGIKELDLMENAGKAVARRTLRFLKERLAVEPGGARVVVCCGRGANGGDGLVAARYLKTEGAKVLVFICPPRKEGKTEGSYPELVRVNMKRALDAGVSVATVGETTEALAGALKEAHVALDALLGTGASGKPAGTIRAMIQALTKSKKPVLAVDVPSGIQPDTGYHSGVYVTAAATLTLGLAKRGLLAGHARQYVGTVEVLDIGYPPALIREAAVDG